MASLDTTISLSTVEEVLAFLGEDVKRDALWLFFSGTAGTTTVQVNDNSVVLIDPDNGTTTFDITVATGTYDTLTKLVAGINAVAGWECGLIYAGVANSIDLLITGALDAEGEENEQVLKIKDNYLITQLINRASDLINRYCNRILKTTTYSREIYYGSGYDRLLLDQFPVTRVIRLSVGRANSFSIKNTSTDANFCTVEVAATTIRLIVNGGTNASDNALTLATYTTIDLLIAAINALGKGWSITTLATDTGSRDASELLIRPSMFVDDAKQAYCETVDDDITDYKLLKPTEARNEGIIEVPGVFTSGYEYHISYVAGYTSPIPYALEQACIALVKYKYDQSKRDSGLKSEKFGEGADYSYTLQDLKNGLPSELLEELNMFKKRDF